MKKHIAHPMQKRNAPIEQNNPLSSAALRDAGRALGWVQEDDPALAARWDHKLPDLALRLADSGRVTSPAMLATIVREDWDDDTIETLFGSPPSRLTTDEA